MVHDADGRSLCSICHEEIDFYAYGSCNHPTCTKCILKLRKFSSADEPEFSKCPTCRRNVNRIVIMRMFIPFDTIDMSVLRHDPRFDFLFSDNDIEEHYSNMLKSFCPICGEEKKSLSALNRHTTIEHQLSYCDLCIRYSRLLPCEFTLMKPDDLAKHRHWDKEKKKGHPPCDFCQERFYEMDDLVHHIRDRHFLCDLCMTSGKFVVFKEQRELLEHYGDSHHLCLDCRAQQRIACFATADLLGMHRFQEHPNEVANDPMAWLPISIELPSVSESHRRWRSLGQYRHGVYSVDGVLGSSDDRSLTEQANFRRPNPAEWTGEDFPTLTPSTSANTSTSVTTSSTLPQTAPTARNQTEQSSNLNGTNRKPIVNSRETGSSWSGRTHNIASVNRNQLTLDDFPSLGATPQSPNEGYPTNRPWIKTNQVTRQLGATASKGIKKQTTDPASDFPTLGSSRPGSSLPISSEWGHSTRLFSSQPTPSPQKQQQQSTPTPSDFPVLSSSTANLGLEPSLQSLALRPNRNKPAPIASKNNAIKSMKPNQQPTSPNVTASEKQSKKKKPSQMPQRNRPDSPQEDYYWNMPGPDSVPEQPQFSHIQTVTNHSLSNTKTPVFTNPRELRKEDFPSLSSTSTTPNNSGLSTLNNQSELNKSNHMKNSNKTGKASDHLPSKRLVSTELNDIRDTECILYGHVQYVPLPDIEQRNRDLIVTVEKALETSNCKNAFTRFADLARRYRHKQISACVYLEGLMGLLSRGYGPDKTLNTDSNSDNADVPIWIAPMLTLLPDVGLQRALLRALQGQGPPKLPAEMRSGRPKEPILTPPTWAKKVLKLVQVCRECGQSVGSCICSDTTCMLVAVTNGYCIVKKNQIFDSFPMVYRKRPKSVRKARALALAREEKSYSKAPHSFVFSRPGVGSMIKQLALDLREIFEPFTASRLRVNRRNVIKDFVAVAGPLNVTHMLYVTHPNSEKRELKRARQLTKKEKKSGMQLMDKSQATDDSPNSPPNKSTNHQGVYLHLVRVPHGPSLTFAVNEYCLKRDIQNLVHRVFDSRQYATAPLLAMVGFGSLRPGLETGQQQRSIPPPHLRLIVDMFQNLLPPLNIQKLKLGTVKRVLLVSREVDPGIENSQTDKDPDDMIYIRHYHIRTEDRGISRALRRLGMGGNKLKRPRLRNSSGQDKIGGGFGPGGSGKSSGVPNLSKYTCMEDFLTRTGLLSDSALSDALSDMEEVELPPNMSLHANIPGVNESVASGSAKRKHKDIQASAHGLRHLGASKRATIRLTEIGPRLTLRLIKIEEGLNTGTVLYHRWQTRSLSEIAEQNERLRNREILRASRRAEHEAHRAANEAAREAHRAACLEGMRKAGQLPTSDSDSHNKAPKNSESGNSSDKNVTDSSTTDDEVETSPKQIFVPQKPLTNKLSGTRSRKSKPSKVGKPLVPTKITKKVNLRTKNKKRKINVK